MTLAHQPAEGFALVNIEVSIGSIAICIASLLITWRFWRFTLCPALHPNEPREFPYWIPFLGHVVGFFKDYNGAIEAGIKYFKNSREPFGITIGGELIYIVPSAQDSAAVWRNSSAISMDPLSDKMYTWMGISKKSRDSLFFANSTAKYNEGNAKPLNPSHMMIEFHHRQGHPGARFDDHFKNKVLPTIFATSNIASGSHPAVLGKTENNFTVSLIELSSHVFMQGLTDAFFSQKIWKASPQILKWFMIWEHTNWKYLFQLPSVMSKDMIKAKDELVAGFTRYVSMPRENRQDASFFMNATEDMLREVGLKDYEIGAMLMLHYWAIVGNVYKLTFWVLAYLVHDAELLETIRSEVEGTVMHGEIDETTLSEKCPVLDSLFNEVLRLTVTSPLGRLVTTDVVIGGRQLRKGKMVMVPFRALHFNDAIWGESSTLYARRFCNEPKLSRNANFRPWGGGGSMCPGRFLAKRAIYALIAILFSKYNLQLAGEPKAFPQADSTKPSPGVVPIVEGQDLLLRLTKR